MNNDEITCEHDCKSTCTMLNEALRKETAIVRYYEGMLEECNFPEVRSFVMDFVDEKRKGILRIIQKLNEIHAKSHTIDGVIQSFDKTEG
ncbi:MAG: hypothetical protein Q8903_02130 [Bacteroidota bacterium]|nr:hypothetical protein [Bacteroidota bacterium]